MSSIAGADSVSKYEDFNVSTDTRPLVIVPSEKTSYSNVQLISYLNGLQQMEYQTDLCSNARTWTLDNRTLLWIIKSEIYTGEKKYSIDMSYSRGREKLGHKKQMIYIANRENE